MLSLIVLNVIFDLWLHVKNLVRFEISDIYTKRLTFWTVICRKSFNMLVTLPVRKIAL